jgi:catechol 2,3-dioxygenase-like lactoylglutathione lyase family enzyme
VTVDLFAGLAVSDYQRALTWYERLLGSGPAFFPNATEAVWELAEHRYLYIEELPGRAGHALHTVFVDDLGDLRQRCTQGDLPGPRRQRDRLRRCHTRVSGAPDQDRMSGAP